MNLSRAYSLAYGEDLSVGRVQTPTLAMLVERELAIRNFVPEDYLEVSATFHRTGGPQDAISRHVVSNSGASGDRKRPCVSADGEEAERIVAARAHGHGRHRIDRVRDAADAPPPLYDLTELQRHANRLFGFSAQQTLDIAQALYERHKLISYPRTDSRHLSKDVAATLPGSCKAIAAHYRRSHRAPGSAPLDRRFVDDAKVRDHHAIIPTATSPRTQLSTEERKIYDLICRRLLSAWHDDHVWSVTTVITAIRNGDRRIAITRREPRFSRWAGRYWISSRHRRAADEAADPVLPPGLKRAMRRTCSTSNRCARKRGHPSASPKERC